MFYGKCKSENIDMLCSSITSPFGPCYCHEHSCCPHALVQQCGSPSSWSLHVHEQSGDPTNISAPITWMVATKHSKGGGDVFWGWAAGNPLLGLLAQKQEGA